jgi:putative PIN family toxin of toxin-antitoxin system
MGSRAGSRKTPQGSMSARPRVVIDTNLVISALVFNSNAPALLRDAWHAMRITPLVSKVTVADLARALAYPKFRLLPEEREELLADYLPWCETVQVTEPPPVPACRNPNDLPFLELAIFARADALLTGDQDLLSLVTRSPCPILRCEAFLQGLPK